MKLLGTESKFHVFRDTFPVPGNGIIGLEFLHAEKAEISFHHDTIGLDKYSIRPIPFLKETPLETEIHDRVTIVSPVESPPDIPPGKTRTHKIAARTRQVIPIDVTKVDIDEGYLLLIDSPEGVFVGHAAVTASNGSCYALAINSTEEDIELQIYAKKICFINCPMIPIHFFRSRPTFLTVNPPPYDLYH